MSSNVYISLYECIYIYRYIQKYRYIHTSSGLPKLALPTLGGNLVSVCLFLVFTRDGMDVQVEFTAKITAVTCKQNSRRVCVSVCYALTEEYALRFICTAILVKEKHCNTYAHVVLVQLLCSIYVRHPMTSASKGNLAQVLCSGCLATWRILLSARTASASTE